MSDPVIMLSIYQPSMFGRRTLNQSEFMKFSSVWILTTVFFSSKARYDYLLFRSFDFSNFTITLYLFCHQNNLVTYAHMLLIEIENIGIKFHSMNNKNWLLLFTQLLIWWCQFFTIDNNKKLYFPTIRLAPLYIVPKLAWVLVVRSVKREIKFHFTMYI